MSIVDNNNENLTFLQCIQIERKRTIQWYSIINKCISRTICSDELTNGGNLVSDKIEKIRPGYSRQRITFSLPQVRYKKYKCRS